MNLTNMWKANGRNKHKPARWLEQDDTQKFLKALKKKFKGNSEGLLKSTKGRYGGTWGHWQIAMSYAKYLSPEFHIWCNEVIMKWIEFEQNPEEGIKHFKQKQFDKYISEGKSEAWAINRLDGKDHRLAFTQALGSGGGSKKIYSEATNLVNQIILGVSAAKFKKIKDVENTRDAMNTAQIHAIALAEELVADALKREFSENGWLSYRERMEIVREVVKPLLPMMRPYHVKVAA